MIWIIKRELFLLKLILVLWIKKQYVNDFRLTVVNRYYKHKWSISDMVGYFESYNNYEGIMTFKRFLSSYSNGDIAEGIKNGALYIDASRLATLKILIAALLSSALKCDITFDPFIKNTWEIHDEKNKK